MSERRTIRWPALAGGVGLVLAVAVGCQAGPGRLVVGGVEFTAPPGSQAPHLAVADGRALLSWLEPAGAGRHALRTALREPGGAWRAPLPDGTWLAHWLRQVAAGPYAYHVALAVSRDGGGSWGAPFRPHGDLSETEHGFVSLVPWNDGAAGVWLDGRGTANDGPMTLRFTTIAPSGVAAPDVEVDPRVCDCCQTALARTTRGLVVAYRGRADGEIRDVAVRRFEDGRWSDAILVSEDGWHYPGCPVNGPAVAARGDTVAVVWFTAAGGTPRVYAAFSTDGGAAFGPRMQVDDGRPAGRVDVV